MATAARKPRIDPKVLFVLCGMALSVLTIWVIYTIVTGAAQDQQQRDADRQACEMAAVVDGAPLGMAELRCAQR
jgi:hypothetical protein